jgi:hypothetical protein
MSTENNNTLLILIASVLIVGTLYLLLKEKKENFIPYSDVNINKSNMLINDTDLNYDKENNQKNSEIIAKAGKKDNYPLGTNDLNIKPPMIPNKKLDPNAAFQENQYIRDLGINNAIDELENADEEDYKDVSNAYNNFLLPIDSNDELSFKKYKDFSKNELDESTLQDLYTKMTSSVKKKLSADELERISGKPIIDSKLSGLYKPIYVSYDNDFDNNIDNKTVGYEYKFEGYSNLPHGSLYK